MSGSPRRIVVGLLLAASLAAFPAHAQWRALGLSGRHVNKLRAHDGFLYACTTNGLYRMSSASPDSSWTLLGFQGQSILDLVGVAPQVLLLGKQISSTPDDTVSLFRSLNDGLSWQPYQNNFGAGASLFARQARRLLRLGAPPTLLALSTRFEKSTDGGASWHLTREQGGVNTMEVAPSNPQVVWAGGETVIFSPFALMSADGGETWKQFTLFAGGDNAVDAIAIHPSDPNVVFLGMEGRVMKTVDGGTNWVTVTSPDPTMYTFGMAIRPFLPLKVYAAGASYTPDPRGVVFHQTQDAGASWQSIAYPADPGPGTFHLMLRSGTVEETLYVATGNGLYRHTQGTVSVPLSTDLDHVQLLARPNPGHGSTTFEVFIPRSETVTLRIFDVHGRVVATLLSGARASGTRQVRWHPDGIPAGLYLAQLQVGRQTLWRKVTLTR